jgi:hypothetical protein
LPVMRGRGGVGAVCGRLVSTMCAARPTDAKADGREVVEPVVGAVCCGLTQLVHGLSDQPHHAAVGAAGDEPRTCEAHGRDEAFLEGLALCTRQVGLRGRASDRDDDRGVGEAPRLHEHAHDVFDGRALREGQPLGGLPAARVREAERAVRGGAARLVVCPQQHERLAALPAVRHRGDAHHTRDRAGQLRRFHFTGAPARVAGAPALVTTEQSLLGTSRSAGGALRTKVFM